MPTKAGNTVTLDAPTLIRVLEYAREDLSKIEGENGDLALHFLADELLSFGKPMTIDDYQGVVSDAEARFKKEGEQPTPSSEPPGEEAQKNDSASTLMARLQKRFQAVKEVLAAYRVPGKGQPDTLHITIPRHTLRTHERIREMVEDTTSNYDVRVWASHGRPMKECAPPGGELLYCREPAKASSEEDIIRKAKATRRASVLYVWVPLGRSKLGLAVAYNYHGPLPDSIDEALLTGAFHVVTVLGKEEFEDAAIRSKTEQEYLGERAKELRQEELRHMAGLPRKAAYTIPEGTDNLGQLPIDYRLRLKQFGLDLYELKQTQAYDDWAPAMLSMFESSLGPGLLPLLPKIYQGVTRFYRENARTLTKMRNDVEGLVRVIDLYHAGKAGRGWYQNAAAMLSRMFPEEKDRETAAQILAATSPRVTVKENAKRFITAYEDYLLGKEFRDSFHKNTLESIRGLGDQWAPAGPKIRNFARALLGDGDACVIDVWMLKALGFDTPKSGIPLATYMMAEKRLRNVAAYLGMPPADVTAKDIASVPPEVATAQEQVWVGIRQQEGEEPTGNPATLYTRSLSDTVQKHYKRIKRNPEKEKIWRPVVEGIQTVPQELLSHDRRRVTRRRKGYDEGEGLPPTSERSLSTRVENWAMHPGIPFDGTQGFTIPGAETRERVPQDEYSIEEDTMGEPEFMLPGRALVYQTRRYTLSSGPEDAVYVYRNDGLLEVLQVNVDEPSVKVQVFDEATAEELFSDVLYGEDVRGILGDGLNLDGPGIPADRLMEALYARYANTAKGTE